jgi:hypothetical protein
MITGATGDGKGWKLVIAICMPYKIKENLIK